MMHQPVIAFVRAMAQEQAEPGFGTIGIAIVLGLVLLAQVISPRAPSGRGRGGGEGGTGGGNGGYRDGTGGDGGGNGGGE